MDYEILMNEVQDISLIAPCSKLCAHHGFALQLILYNQVVISKGWISGRLDVWNICSHPRF